MLAGSYRQDDALQLFDIRTMKCTRTFDWDGLDGGKSFVEKDVALIPKVDTEEDEKEYRQRFKPQSAPMLYAAMFNRKQDLILAGGAGKNQVRIFDVETGNLVAVISDMARAVMCMDIAHTSQGFAFGCADSCVRLMDI